MSHLLDEALKLEQRAAELRRQARQEEEQAAEASKLEVRIRRAVTLPRRVNGMHPAAFDDTRMPTEILDAEDRARPPSIRFNQADALVLADVVECLRHLNGSRDSVENAFSALKHDNTRLPAIDRLRLSHQDVIVAALKKLDGIWK